MSNSYRWCVVGLLTALAILNYADRAVVPALLPLLRDRLGLSAFMMGALNSAFLWSYGLGAPSLSFATERMPRVKVITWSLAGWSLAVVLSGVAANAGQLMLTRVLLGLAQCTYVPAALALLSEYHPDGRRAAAIGLPLAGCTLGAFVGGLAGGYCGDHFGWRTAFYFLGFVGLALAPLTVAVLRPIARAERSRQERAAALSLPRHAWGELFRVKSFRIILLGNCSLSIPSWVFISWLPYFFHEKYGLSLTGSVLAGMLAVQVAATLGYAFGGYVSDWVSGEKLERRMLLQSLCYLAGAPFLLVFAGHGGILLLNAGIFMASLLRGVGSANDQVLTCEVLPPGLRASAVGLYNGLGVAFGAAGVLGAGWVLPHLGLSAVFAGMGAAYLCSAALSQLGYRRYLAADLAAVGK